MGTKPFAEFREISQDTQQVLGRLGYTHATPVQEACIPLFTGNKDVAVDACTGSGKTLAFVVPMIEKLRKLEDPLRKTQIGAIIISPTRELAQQIYRVAEPFIATVPWLTSILLVGGSDPSHDVKAAEGGGCNIVVGTPGRINDVMQRSKVLDARHLEVLILDEADRLLDLGFKEQLDSIMACLPRQRRTGLFSATQTEAVRELARAGLRNPVRVKVAVRANSDAAATAAASGQRTPLGLRITYRVCESDQKLSHLIHFLKEHRQCKVIAYVLTCAMVDLLASLLKALPAAKGLDVRPLHGRMKQNQRQAALAAFAEKDAGCLLCTDVAARGLDIPDVDWVLQLDPPQAPDAFVHRVGRTARMGRAGAALALLLPHELTYVDLLRVRKVPLEEEEEVPEVPDVGPSLRGLAEKDRDILEKGVKAFVSYIRGYKEHQCQYIFRLQEMDLAALARACALLRLPKMPEVRRLRSRTEGFQPSAVDPHSVKFKDKARQKAREKALAAKAAEREAAGEEAAVERQRAKQRQAAEKPEKKLTAARRRLLEDRQDEADVLEEYRLLKRLRRGKISTKEFDIATGLLDDESAAAAAAEEGFKGNVDQETGAHEKQPDAQKQRRRQKATGKDEKLAVKPIRQGLKDMAARKEGLLGKKKRRKKRQRQDGQKAASS